MKKLSDMTILILLSIFLIGSSVAVSGAVESVPTNDEAIIRQSVIEMFNAHNTKDIPTLIKYMGPNLSEFYVGGTGLNRFFVDGNQVASTNDEASFNFKPGLFHVTVYGNTATVLGYMNGRVSLAGGIVEEGPWRMSLFWVKVGNQWKQDHVNLSKLAVPKLQYLIQLPQGYDQTGTIKWPLIIFLHGIGERGNDLDLVKKQGVPQIASIQKNFPFVVVSPQCPLSNLWSMLPYSLDNLLDEVITKYQVDPERVYLTGLSMGGYGTWALAIWSPDRFAAIAPVCGGGDVTDVARIKNIPVWVFHGANDSTVPLRADRNMVNALKACGGDVRFTVYPDVGHDAWTNAYNTPELYTWFLQHTRMKK